MITPVDKIIIKILLIIVSILKERGNTEFDKALSTLATSIYVMKETA